MSAYTRALSVTFFLLCVLAHSAAAIAQSMDGFRPDPNGPVRAYAWQADGKLLIGGAFTSIHGLPVARIARLHRDGSLDTTFSANIIGGEVTAIVVEPNGNIVVGGAFSHVGPTARTRIARFTPNGKLDPTFNPGANGTIRDIVRQPDGRFVFAGNFSVIAGQSRTFLARLNTNGSFDSSFSSAANAEVATLFQQADGRILLGGSFSSIAGITRSRVARIHANGQVDATFNPGANNSVIDIIATPQGVVFMGGAFTQIGGATRMFFAVVRADGTIDSTARNANNWVTTLALQADGSVLIGGDFTQFDGNARNFVARLHPTGFLDTLFTPSAGGRVDVLAAQPDGRIIIGGDFTEFGDEPRSRLARVERGGQLDDTYSIHLPRNGIHTIAVDTDRKALVGGAFNDLTTTGTGIQVAVRVNIDGTLDPSYGLRANAAVGVIVAGEASDVIAGAFNNISNTSCRALARIGSTGSIEPGSGLCNVNGEVFNALSLRNGRMIVAGNFSQVGTATRTNIARLTALGALDTTFNVTLDGAVFAVAEQADGRLIVAGQFSTVNGQPLSRLVRLLESGAPDPTFTTQLIGSANALAIDPMGRIFVAGFISQVNGVERHSLIRLLPNGALDSSFVAQNSGGNIAGIQLMTNGDVIAFGKVTLAGVTERIAKFRGDGSLDPNFAVPAEAITAAALQDDGRLLIGGIFDTVIELRLLRRVEMIESVVDTLTLDGSTVVWTRGGVLPELMAEPTLEYSTNGATFSAIEKMTWSNGAWRLPNFDAPVGPVFHLRAVGQVRSGSYNGSTGVVRSSVRIQRSDLIFKNGFEF